jgi:predicted MFS family arabinose efflux permease
VTSPVVLTQRPAAETPTARWAVLVFFLAQGIVIGSWVAQIPIVKERFRLDDAVLGLTLLAVAVGSVSSLLSTSHLIARFGSRWVTWVMTLLLAATLPLISIVAIYPALVALLVLFGAFASAMDVAMNAQAVGVEARLGRPVLSTFHGIWSVGGLIGAGLASLALSNGISDTLYLALIAVGLVVVASVGRPRLLPAENDRRADQPVFVRPPRALVGLGLLAILAMMSEGAIGDWSGVYLRDWLKTDVGFAATGYATFALTMTIGRLLGDTLRTRLDSSTLLRLCGGLAALGLGIALLGNHPIVALAGFGCVGLGLANVIPIVFSLTGRIQEMPTATAVAAVATCGYAGNFIGPPLIGFVAQSTSLPIGLGLIVLFSSSIAIAGKPTVAHS